MAIDSAMFVSFSRGYIPPTLRLYGWDREAFSTGRFQKPADVLNEDMCAKRGIAVVNRCTAGGTLFHGCGITYSVVCAVSDIPVEGTVRQSYRKLCSFLIHAYQRMGLNAAFALDEGYQDRRTCRMPFCLAGTEAHDILINGRKIGGNAQRRTRNVIFQHGSIPFSLPGSAIKSCLKEPGIWDDNSSACLDELLGAEGAVFHKAESTIASSFEETFGVSLKEGGLSDGERALCAYACGGNSYGA